MAGTRIHIVKYEPSDSRLGRHVEHDERSKLPKHTFLEREAKPKHKTTHWTSQAPPLDQGQLGSCTGNATAQWLNTDFATGARARTSASGFLTEEDALKIYEGATRLDHFPGQYPPEDTGSTGNAAAKAAVKLGWLNSYGWLFSFTSVQAAIEKTPLSSGTLWTNSMFDPVNGLVKVGKLTDSNIAGGHQYLMSGIDWNEDVFEFRQSWGDWPGSKPGGYFAISFNDFQSLLEADGDITVPKWS